MSFSKIRAITKAYESGQINERQLRFALAVVEKYNMRKPLINKEYSHRYDNKCRCEDCLNIEFILAQEVKREKQNRAR